MKRTFFFMSLLMAALFIASCNGNKSTNDNSQADSTEVEAVADSTIYGVCGSGTSMHSLELITDEGDTLSFLIDPDQMMVKGGMMAGDRMAVVGTQNVDGELTATQAINITTLMGRWTSIDKNFEIQEGGIVESAVKAESHPWATWKICNCHLVLNTDTFSINMLGADSLYLENAQGIFAFKRQYCGKKADKTEE